MASRLGLLPWERDRLSPAELKELWEGFTWRRSRNIEVVASVVLWLVSLMTDKIDYGDILRSMPGYDGEHERMMRAAAQDQQALKGLLG